VKSKMPDTDSNIRSAQQGNKQLVVLFW